jgi:hypothetical protein
MFFTVCFLIVHALFSSPPPLPPPPPLGLGSVGTPEPSGGEKDGGRERTDKLLREELTYRPYHMAPPLHLCTPLQGFQSSR